MASKKKELQLQAVLTTQSQWEEMLLTKGVTVIDVYQAWCGPCKAVVNLFRKLKNEYGEDELLQFAVAEADNIVTLQPFRDKCEPVFLFCVDGKIIAIVRGANAPLLSKTVIELVEEERKIVAGEIERPEVKELVFLEEKNSDAFAEGSQLDEGVTYTVAIIKPDAVTDGRVEEVKQKIIEAGFGIAAAEEKILTEEQIREFYSHKTEQPDFEDFVQFMMSGPCHILIVCQKQAADDNIPNWKELSESDENLLEESESQKLSRLGEVLENENMLNVCDVQDSIEEASRQLAFFFPNFGKKKTGQNAERTLALIRPSLLKENKSTVLQRIKDDGFTIVMQREVVLTEEQAREFYKEHENEDYFPILLEQMTSGPTLALALVRENAVQRWRDLLGPKTLEEAKEKCPTRGPSMVMILSKENAVEEWRQLMGPADPEAAKMCSPNSIRAQFAQDILHNAVHGSSNKEHALKSIEYVFGEINLESLSHK
ncbi:thioredoxin domain-containing protein 3 isoform X4 [Alligator mississippiensis]|uniref:thioredoxin domain-containing protein 3 isoform X4 n=1 Tax=Alligator mississippiensis TaxID=8496 RepID=UPI00287733B2|nr:thioredoxin domain-containing protein 3 isoform X4 [Alligator mississippiensis]